MEKCPKCSYTFTPGDFLPNTSVDPSGQDFSMLLILEGPYNGLESNELNLEAPDCDGGQNELIIDSSVLNSFNYVEIGESVVDGNSTAVSISEAIGSAEVANLLSEDHVESTVAITEQSENINLSQMESLKVQSNRTTKDSNETVSTGSCESKSPRKKSQKSKGSKKGHLAASQFQYICEFCGKYTIININCLTKA